MKVDKIVVVGDTHAHEDYDNKRFDAIGEFAAQELQGVEHGVLVQMGDFSDVMGFNSHGKKIEMEGRRWKSDIEVTHDALDRLDAPFKRRKRKLPYKVVAGGNHEHRVERFISENPHLAGAISVDDLGFSRFGWDYFPFGKMVSIGGINFVHHLSSQTGGAAKINSPTNGIKSIGTSTVVGHSHSADVVPVYYRDRTIWGIDSGCAIHKDMGFGEGWSHGTAHKYRRCVWVFENIQDGDFDFRMVRLETLGV
jgi:hypothetical protein